VAGALRICDYVNKPVVLSFLFLRGAKCEPQFDRLEQIHRQFPSVNVIGVFFERNRGKVRDAVREHGWTFPIVVDRDGAISNLYAIGGCPTTVFATRGGTVRKTVPHVMAPAELEREVKAVGG
jgi:cytochrome c biogenesis protein CcmG, thiol:disulfide interchange protein DsbE